jgi:ABC-2 type transport system ATP-binding protein
MGRVIVDSAVVTFPGFQLGPISLEVREGEIACVIGANGSGKTTLLRSIVGLQRLSAGTISVFGCPSAGRSPALLNMIGWVPDDQNALVEDLTASELWQLHAHGHALAGAERGDLAEAIAECQRWLDFFPPSALLRSFSHGMRKKTQLVAALMHKPRLIILDEPHNGLDPIAIETLDRGVERLRELGHAIVISTHDLFYAERVADHVVILNGGQLVADGSTGSVIGGRIGLRETFFNLVGES